jgi:hypothetical protein
MTMTEQHPITPPPELVQQWINEADGGHDPRWQDYEQDIATRAAQWGADQELEACCSLLELSDKNVREFLQSGRRPKPPSLKEQALAELAEWESVMDIASDSPIRRALEQLDD